MPARIEPQVKIVDVDAKLARELLATNKHNRKLNDIRVSNIGQMILRGEWRLTPDAIGVIGRWGSRGAQCYNAQHRLNGIVWADENGAPGITVPMLFLDGLSSEAVMVTDAGKVRTLADSMTFTRAGEEITVPTEKLSAMVKLAYHVVNGTYVYRQPTPTIPQQMEFYADNADSINDAAVIGLNISKELHYTATGIMVGIWVMSRGTHQDRLAEFVEQVTYGENITRNDVAYHLRRKLADWKAESLRETGGNYRRPWVIVALFVNAWNAFINGEPTLGRLTLSEIPDPK